MNRTQPITILRRETKTNLKFMTFLLSLQLSDLEQRVIEAEGRAEEAEDKVNMMQLLFKHE